jgi:hypothetical protein
MKSLTLLVAVALVSSAIAYPAGEKLILSQTG